MNETSTDPRCPKCGEPIGVRATYCMHCSTDLTEERAAADVDGDSTWDRAVESDAATDAGSVLARVRGAIGDRFGDGAPPQGTPDEQLLDPDGIVDDTLTIVVGIAAGVVVGVVLTIELLAMTGSPWALLAGLVGWLGATAYLVRHRTVQGAVAASGYAIALVLLLIPVVAFSPVADVEGGLAERGGLFLALATFVVVPVFVAALLGWLASRFLPAAGGTDGK
jgi:hypothetical protein